VISYSDGGGAVRASCIPVVGVDHVAKYLRAFADRFWIGVEVEDATVNGQAAALLRRDGEFSPSSRSTSPSRASTRCCG
jgi:hypothetical protein